MSENMNKIERLNVLYDNKEEQFLRAYVTRGGKTEILENHDEIYDAIITLRNEYNVSSIVDLPKKVLFKESLYNQQAAKEKAYFPNTSLDDWSRKQDRLFRKTLSNSLSFEEQDNQNRILNGKLNLKSPYVGKKVRNFCQLVKNHKVKFAVGSGAVAVLALVVGLTGCKFKKTEKEEEPKSWFSKVITLPDEIEKEESVKKIPNTWEEYLTYEDSIQKQFLTEKVMEENMKQSVKTLTIDGKDVQMVIPAEQIGASLLYYAASYYDEKDLVEIIGDYDVLTNLPIEREKFYRTLAFNLIYAKSIDEVYIPVTGDQIADDANEKIFKSLYDAIHASNAAEKKEKINTLNQEMREYHIEASTAINLLEHPTADIHLEVANTVFNSHRAMTGDALFTDEISKQYFGTQENYDVEQVGTVNRVHGLNDKVCSILDEKMDSAVDFRTSSLMNDKYEELTVNTYSLPHMYTLMNDYIKREYDIENVYGYEDVYKDLMSKVGSTESRGEFNPDTNPAGGKKGDTYSKTEKNVNIKDSELTEKQKEEAQKSTDTVPADKVEEEANKITLTWIQVYNATYNHFARESVCDASGAAYSDSWASEYPDAWGKGKEDGLQYKADKEAAGKVEDTPIENPEIPSHNQNPNQNGNQNQDTPTDTVDTDYTGDVTTDDSDVWNPEDYGEVQSYSSFEMSDVDLTAYIELIEAASYEEEEIVKEKTF